jgi:cell surface protein SprA
VIILAAAFIAMLLLCPRVAHAQIGSLADSLARVDSLVRADSLRADSVQRGLAFPFPGRNDTAVAAQRLRMRDSLRAHRDSLNFFRDSLHVRRDTLKVDTTWVVYKDSTSRIRQFVHRRRDGPSAEFFPRENQRLFLRVRSPAYTRDVTIDSSGQYVSAREMVNGKDVRIPNAVPLNDYIQLRSRQEIRNNWREFVSKYQYKENRDQLGGFFSSLTSIEIPVPANPLLSIFGGRGIKLNVSGAVDIRAAFRNQKSDQVTVSQLDQSRSEPDFNQDVQVNVNGTVGDKLNILADWNTQRTFEYENQLKIKYTGYDDEIVQSVEAGNVSLQTPSLIGGGQALFGIKARMQAGPMTLTTLLSQKKGQTKELTLTGGAQSNAFDLYPWQYSRNYYFVDTSYRKNWEVLHSSTIPDIGPYPDIVNKQIVQIDVWQNVQIINQQNYGTYVKASAYIDMPPHQLATRSNPGTPLDTAAIALFDTTSPGRFKSGYWTRLDPSKDYRYDRYGGYITILTNVNEQVAYAVNYITADGTVYGDSVEHKFYLKMVKPENLQDHPSYKPAWDLMLKNVYPLGGRDLKQEGFDFKLLRRTEAAPIFQIYSTNLLQVLSLDRFNASGVLPPDGVFDFLKGITVDVDRAEVIFPTLRPFDSTIVQYFRKTNGIAISDSLLFHDIYDTTVAAVQNNNANNRYYMHVTSSTSQSSRYPLGFNLVEGSVQVLLNGSPLQPNIDYTVDYIVGEVVIRNPAALVPGANVQVKYETNDLFQLASKTLIGARGEVSNFLPNTNLGFTVMNLSQATLSDKVRLGEEPTQNLIGGADMTTSFNLPFLTSLIGSIPFYHTREMSSIRLSGEAAYVIPNPNTKTSTIADDNGASIAYLDDFEGARRTIPLPISYTQWHLASPPVYSLLPGGLTPAERSYYKAKLAWYNRLPSDVVSQEIWPLRQVRTGENQVTVLNLDYDPDRRGMFNYSPRLDSTLHREGTAFDLIDPRDSRQLRQRNWAGVMRYMNNTGGLLDQNISYLELWMKVSGPDLQELKHGRLYVDLGRISEDVIPNGRLNSEDLIVSPDNPSGIPNNVLNPGEDVGLDMLADSAERRVYADFLESNRDDSKIDSLRLDPSGDDWAYVTGSGDFSHLNGEEGNGNAVDGRLPETEDLNSNGSADQVDLYAEYEVPLDSVYIDSLGREQRNTLIVGGNVWRQIRIPLFDANRIIGGEQSITSVLSDVQYMRLWVSGVQHPVSIRIAEMDFVGNQWLERTQSDSTLKVSTVNIEDNPSYVSPPGVIRERDKTQPDQVILGNEQSLALILDGLRRGDSRQVYRSFAVRPLDLFNYKAMKMFVHGDNAFGFFGPDRYDAEVFIRFGSDSLNFYEYRAPVHPGWDPLNDMNIVFSELTSVKASRDSVNKLFIDPVSKYRKDAPPGASYGIRGNPSLRQIREISIGIENPAAQGGRFPLVGQVWVNELRLTDVNNAKGYAYHFDTQVKLADLGGVSFNYAKTDPNFHALDQSFGNQNTTVSWGVNSSISLDKFFSPAWAGTTVPLGYSHTENLTKPVYLPGSDVVVTSAADRAAGSRTDPKESARVRDSVITGSQYLHVQDSYSLPNFRLVLPTQLWFIRDTFSKLSYSFNYTTAHDRDPSITTRSSWLWNFRVSYGLSLPEYYVQPFKSIFSGIFMLDGFKDWKFYYVPINNLSANVSAQRSRTFELGSDPASIPRDTRNFSGGKSFGFGWKLTEGGLLGLAGDYGASLDKNLLPLDNDSVGRGFQKILRAIFVAGEDSRFGQRVTINSKPKIPDVFDLPKYATLNAGYAVNYGWQNSFQNGDLGKSAGWDNNITLSLDFRLKSFTDPWFRSSGDAAQPPAPSAAPKNPSDTSAGKDKPQTEKKSNASGLLAGLKTAAKIFLQIPFLNYETINISFSQTNRVSNSGVVGATGFQNFWARAPWQGSLPRYGPSRLYQLGLVSDPSGDLRFTPSSRFPFLGWTTEPGIRPPYGALSDQFGQTNNVTLRTNRPLWEGATLELNWKVGWQFQKNTTFQTNQFGFRDSNSATFATQGSIERTYLSIPPVFIFKPISGSLEKVGKNYDEALGKGTPAADALAESFEKGLEALPFLNRIFGQYVPRPNWTVRWDGVEKVIGISSVVDRMSFEHSYSSSFRRDFRGDLTSDLGGERTDVERVVYGFAPLLGVNASFKEVLKGNLSGNLRYNTATTYDLNIAGLNIVETGTQEMSLSLTYSRKGFKFPLFGLNLSNDVDLSVTFSRAKNARRSYDPAFLSLSQEGIPIEGSTRTNLEPRIRYVLSSRVSAALFYRLTKIAPDDQGSPIPGTTTNEAGVEIHITI